MAEINAEIDDVIAAMTTENARQMKDNAILVARLANANRTIDRMTNENDALRSENSQLRTDLSNATAASSGADVEVSFDEALAVIDGETVDTTG